MEYETGFGNPELSVTHHNRLVAAANESARALVQFFVYAIRLSLQPIA